MKIRAILDTNLWISYLISKELSKIDVLLERDEITLIFSIELIEEFIEVALRPKFRNFFSVETIGNLLDLFDSYGELVDVTSRVEACRDPKDNFLLALAKDGHVDFLVTGDADLLELGHFEGAEILRFSDFELRIFPDGRTKG